jgi:hypothetical protein
MRLLYCGCGKPLFETTGRVLEPGEQTPHVLVADRCKNCGRTTHHRIAPPVAVRSVDET